MHDLDTGEQDSGAAKRLESEHRPGDAFDSAVVLLNEVVQVLRLAHLDGQAAVSLDARDRCRICAALLIATGCYLSTYLLHLFSPILSMTLSYRRALSSRCIVFSLQPLIRAEMSFMLTSTP